MNVIRDFNLEHDSGRTSKEPGGIYICTCTCATGWRLVRAQGAQAISCHKLIHHRITHSMYLASLLPTLSLIQKERQAIHYPYCGGR